MGVAEEECKYSGIKIETNDLIGISPGSNVSFTFFTDDIVTDYQNALAKCQELHMNGDVIMNSSSIDMIHFDYPGIEWAEDENGNEILTRSGKGEQYND